MDPRVRAAIEAQNTALERMQPSAADELERIANHRGRRQVTAEQRTTARSAFDQARNDYQTAESHTRQMEELAEARSVMPRELTREAERTRGGRHPRRQRAAHLPPQGGEQLPA
jgi:hypothetical protein